MKKTPRRRRGFTIFELMMTVAILSVLSVIAYPALQGITGRDREAGVATYVARLINRVRSQARMRNRAYAVLFDEFDVNQPRGKVTIREGDRNRCAPMQAAANDNNSRLMQIFTMGQTPEDPLDIDGNVESGKDDDVGLFGALPAGALDGGRVRLCVRPDGSVWNLTTLGPFTGDRGMVSFRLQRFDKTQGGAWVRSGPPRGLEVPFAGPSRLGLQP